VKLVCLAFYRRSIEGNYHALWVSYAEIYIKLSPYLKEMLMSELLLLKSVFIGVSIAAPVGPIGLLCMQHTLRKGFRAGVFSGFGAATADALYGVIAVFGLSTPTHFFTQLTQPLALLGAIFLIYLGISFLLKKPQDEEQSDEQASKNFKLFSSTLLLTLANPMTIIAFVAIFSSLGGELVLSFTQSIILVFGVFLGSAIWWLMLCAMVSVIRDKISAKTLLHINKLAGLALIVFGVYQLYPFAVRALITIN